HPGEEGDAVLQPPAVDRQQVRLRHGQIRSQHRKSRSLMRRPTASLKARTTAVICSAGLQACLAIALSAAGGGVSLIDAVKAGDRAAVRTLATKSAVNVSEADGMTALHWAVRNDDADMVGVLMRAGANVNAANRYGITPL